MEHDDLAKTIEEAVRRGMADHPCRFTEGERAGLHLLAKMKEPHLDALRYIGIAMSGGFAKLGQFMALAFLAALIYLVAWCGKLPIPNPFGKP